MSAPVEVRCPRGFKCETPNACAGGADCRLGPDLASQRKPWADNRHGDPRQLLHEAAILDDMAARLWATAGHFRALAVEKEGLARSAEEAARDYRRWASETRS